MKRNTKIIWIGVSAVLLLGIAAISTICLFVRVFTHHFVTDPLRIRQIGVKIADYTTPPGYREKFGLDLIHDQMVILVSIDALGPDFKLLQRPAKGVIATPEHMERTLLKEHQNRHHTHLGDFSKVDTETLILRGHPVLFTISENKSGAEVVREEFGTFEGNQGLATLMVIGPADHWNQDLIHNFVASLH
jgi:hypothetical protein